MINFFLGTMLGIGRAKRTKRATLCFQRTPELRSEICYQIYIQDISYVK
jgi:hypothetical protein